MTTSQRSASTAAGDAPGPLIAGRYRLGSIIGRGGMATIHRAEDTRSGRPVALKILRPEMVADRDLADRFRREALAATVLRHRNIVGCIDTGTGEDGPYLVMELVEGEDLGARLRRDGALPAIEVARIGLDVARGLGAAHLRGIVHRDVKPGNILLARDGRALITDFGIARLAMDAEATQPGTTLGSVQYFSPEQARGAATSPASDVYGLGLVMYEALTGRRPWSGATSSELALVRVGAVAPSPRDLEPTVPARLDAIVTRCLAADAEDRYPNGNVLASELETLVPPRVDTAQRATGASARPRRPERPWIARLGIIGGVALGAAAGFALLVGGGGEAGTTTSSDRPTSRAAGPTAIPSSVGTRSTGGSSEATLIGDVCHPILDVACALGVGRYAPSGLTPPVAFTLRDGWRSSIAITDLLVLTRPEGALTLATNVRSPSGDDGFKDGSAKRIVAALAKTAGTSATKPASVRIDGRTGRSVDITADGAGPVAMFEAGGRTYQLEPGRTTRFVALDDAGGTLVLVIEPADGQSLRDILDTADVVASTLSFE